MQPETFEVGRQLGHEGVEHVVGFVERYCDCERRRIELVNRAGVTALRAEIALRIERERDLKEALRQAPPPGDIRSRRRKALYYWVVTGILTIAAFFFSIIAFDPYRLGWKSYLYCLGIAIVTPFCVEKFLETWGKEKLIKALATVAFVAAISSLVCLAVIRGDVLAQQIKNIAPAVTFEDDAPATEQPHNSFYEETLVLLRLVMALLAVAMELGAGLALYDARRLGKDGGIDSASISTELAQVRAEMISILLELTALENEPAVFETRFWRDFYRSMLTHTARNALGKLLLAALAFLILLPSNVFAAQRVNLVVLVDLTQSVNVAGHDSKSELERNFHAVTQLLAQITAGSHVSIIGITESSFSQPYILLTADIADDEGYFKEKLANARQQLVAAWTNRTRRFERNCPRTDVIGVLLLAGQIFHQLPSDRRNILVILSDMRHNAGGLSLKASQATTVDGLIRDARTKGLIADLKGDEVYVMGVDNAGQDVAEWNRLREIWKSYFNDSGARVSRYSVLRDPIDMTR